MQVTEPGAADPLGNVLARARGILPDQGPIGVFIHHNTLHAFQHETFHVGVQAGAAFLGARPYPELAQFRAWFRSGRIAACDLDAELDAALAARGDDRLAIGLTRRALWRLLMVDTEDDADEAGMRFLVDVAATPPCDPRLLAGARRCVERSGARLPPPVPAPRRHRDVLLALGGADVDEIVHPELVRLCASFLDQGQAAVALPHRREGFLRAVAYLADSGFPMPSRCPGVAADLRAVLAAGQTATGVIQASLRALDVQATDVDDYLLAVALVLPGWAGMFARLEQHPTESHGSPTTLRDYLAVRLLLERRAVERVAQEVGAPIGWCALRSRTPVDGGARPTVDAVLLARIAAAAHVSPDGLGALSVDSVRAVWAEIAAFPAVWRRQVWLDAYERTYRCMILDALWAHRPRALGRTTPARPTAQFVFCIDEREESLRRALEEQGACYDTFGVAGFFGLAIDFAGLDDHAPAAHCPVVVTPGHEVFEHAVPHDEARHLARTAWRQGWHGLERRLGALSRSLAGGAGLALAMGPVAGLLTATRVFLPRTSLAARARFEASMAPRPTTRLSGLRQHDAPSPRGKMIGFSLDEAVDRVENVLRSIGLVERFAPTVVICGHGSTSLNNPHESAHDCGACGGRRGGANARLFADIVNRSEVRQALAARGIIIPDDTWFVGALHDTSNDDVTYYDLDAMPDGHRRAFGLADGALDIARRESARERCRRFDDIALGGTAEAALEHVEARASHLAQPRPEYGHCTNAIAIVGRRALSRGLHLDRRAFLVSYDPAIDPQHTLIERILAAVGPVGAGISLEYYFSSVDNEVFGCGTKLPHNVTGLLGVMNGHQGDLRTGLPLQMVELHEPMRLLLIVEATPEVLLGVAARQPEVRELVVNRWVQLVSVHPETGAMQVFEGTGFVPYTPSPVDLPVVERSIAWHGGVRAHVPPAVVTAALREQP
jgi:uncharacterized protein